MYAKGFAWCGICRLLSTYISLCTLLLGAQVGIRSSFPVPCDMHVHAHTLHSVLYTSIQSCGRCGGGCLICCFLYLWGSHPHTLHCPSCVFQALWVPGLPPALGPILASLNPLCCLVLKDWRQEEKGMTEDEMVGWHHRLDGHEFVQASGDGDGQGSLVCCSPRGCKELDTTEWLNWTECLWEEDPSRGAKWGLEKWSDPCSSPSFGVRA